MEGGRGDWVSRRRGRNRKDPGSGLYGGWVSEVLITENASRKRSKVAFVTEESLRRVANRRRRGRGRSGRVLEASCPEDAHGEERTHLSKQHPRFGSYFRGDPVPETVSCKWSSQVCASAPVSTSTSGSSE